jgi:histidinol-phosphate aminotransferase
MIARRVADSLRQRGLGNPRDLNRLAVIAAIASLRDTEYLPRVQKSVSHERTLWNQTLDELKLTHTTSFGNFVYFDSGRPHAQVANALRKEGIEVARIFPPYDRWIRITIGLPQQNQQAQTALRKIISSSAIP